jgi:hypothetical protein
MSVDHVALPVPHHLLEEEIKFLNAALAPLGIKEHYRPVPEVVGFGPHPHKLFLWVSGINDGEPITKDGNSVHLALTAKGS